MPVFSRRIRLLVLALLLAVGGLAQAHQVPVMQIEAEFLINTNYTLRINLDPRVFLSGQPSSLPPVPASWYRDQSPEQIQATEKAAMAYLRKNVKLQFGVDEAPLPDCTFVAMDGANNEPITAATEEVHLLATAKGEVPGTGRNFTVNLGRETGVSLILLNTMEGQNERKPRVVFPGESSDPFPLTGMRSTVTAAPDLKTGLLTALEASLAAQSWQWLLRGGVAVALFVIYNLFLKKRRNPKLVTRKRGR